MRGSGQLRHFRTRHARLGLGVRCISRRGGEGNANAALVPALDPFGRGPGIARTLTVASRLNAQFTSQ